MTRSILTGFPLVSCPSQAIIPSITVTLGLTTEARSAMFLLRRPSCMEPLGVIAPIMFLSPSVTPAPPWIFSLGTLIMALSRAVLAILTFFKASGSGGLTSTKSSSFRSTSSTCHLSLRASTPATLKALKVSECPQPSPTIISSKPCRLRYTMTPSITLASVVIPVDGCLSLM